MNQMHFPSRIPTSHSGGPASLPSDVQKVQYFETTKLLFAMLLSCDYYNFDFFKVELIHVLSDKVELIHV